jgi:hypothetical protein
VLTLDRAAQLRREDKLVGDRSRVGGPVVVPYYQRMVEEMTAHGIDVKTLRETSGKRGRDSRRLRTTRHVRASARRNRQPDATVVVAANPCLDAQVLVSYTAGSRITLGDCWPCEPALVG